MFFTLFCIVLVMVSVLHGLEIQTIFFFFDWATNWACGGRARGARRGGFGFRKKTRLLNRVGSGFGVRPVGRVRA